MKIIRIFAENVNLFAFQYKGEKENELRRLLNLWNDTSYLFDFIIKNKSDIPNHLTLNQIVIKLIEDANDIDRTLSEIIFNPERKLEDFFRPLNNQEYQIIELSKQKGRKNYLRLFAIKIDTNCFVITGGAIKLHHLNKDRIHTQIEMQKISRCRDFLRDNGVFDLDSFYEFLIDQS